MTRLQDRLPRQVLKPKRPKLRRLRLRPLGPELCGAVHPERPGIVDGETGEQLVDPVTCDALVHYEFDEKKRKEVRVTHRGDHRAHLLRGIVERWPATNRKRGVVR